MAELACSGAGAAAAHLERVDLERGEVEVIATAGAAVSAVGVRALYRGSLAEDVLERGGPEVLGPDALSRRPGAGMLAEACRRCTALVVPLISGGCALGALILLRPVDEPPFAPAEVSRARELADMAAIALRHLLLQRERERDHAALEESERRFRLLVHGVCDYAIFMLDPDGRVVSWNDGAQRTRGYSEEEVLGRHFSMLYSQEDRRRGVPDHELAVAAREGVHRDEGWRVRKDGSRFWAHVTVTAVRDRDGAPLGFAMVTRDLTEQKATEAALRESEERFRQLAENAREVFWLYDADFSQVAYVSPAFEAVWHRPADALHRDPAGWFSWVHAEDQERVRDFTRTLKERPGTIDYRIVRPDGGVRWLWTRAFPVRDASGSVVRVGGVTEDITEEKEVEKRLLFLAEAGRVLGSSLDYRETLMNVAHLAVPHVADWCVVDVREDGSIHRLGAAHADPEKEAITWEVARRYPPDPDAPHGVAQVIRTGQPQLISHFPEDTLRQVSKDEEHFRLLSQLGLRSSMIVPMTARGRTLGAITLIAAESGRSYGLEDLRFAEELASRAALAVDNARLYRQAEQARGEAERRARQEAALRRTAEAVTATFSIQEVIQQIAANSLEATNADGAFVKRLHPEMNEVEVVAVAGKLVPPLGARTPYPGSYTKRVMESGGPVLVPSFTQAKHTLFDSILATCDDCAAMILPLIDAGEAIGTLVLTRLPERHGFRPDEMERARTFADLASLAFRKIHLLRESEQRREELEDVMESRARLIRGFTHDLKNPLGAADGYLDLVESGIVSDPERLELSISRARRAIRSALDLINDLSELARAEAGHVEVDLAPVDVRAIARELVEEYRAQAEAKGLTIWYEVPDDIPVIESDASRLRQILGNLISNAIKYTDRGRVDVVVGTGDGWTPPAAGRWVATAVADTGSGIPEERRHLLFREFTRLNPTASPGAGLGLAISQRIAEALSGTITVESTPGEGSVFTLWVPASPTRAGDAR